MLFGPQNLCFKLKPASMSVYMTSQTHIVSLNVTGWFAYTKLLSILAETLFSKKIRWVLELFQGSFLCVVDSRFSLFPK